MIGFVGLDEIAFQCFDVLALPLLALVYPLCCSVRAMETNSISDIQKLNAYWVVYSLSLLFEHSFLKLLEWLPLWQYIRIMIVFLLVIPHFDGAFYVYKNLICPCLTMGPQLVINWFSNWGKELFIRENVLSKVDRYVKETGHEALERIVSSKVGQAEASLIGTGKCNLAAMEENKEKGIEVAADREIPKTPPLKKVHEEWTCASSQIRTQNGATFNSYLDGPNLKDAYEALIIKYQADPKLTEIENSTFAVAEAKLNPVELATGREVMESSTKVQKEWILNSELEGERYTAAYEALEAENLVYVHKLAPVSTVTESDQPSEAGKSTPSSGSKQKGIINEKGQKNTIPTSVSKNSDKSKEEPTKSVSSNGLKRNTVENFKEKVQGEQENPNEVPKMKDSRLFCKLCNVRCPGEIDMVSHINGMRHKENAQEQQKQNLSKHKEKVQGEQQNLNEVPRMKDSRLFCKICNVRCTSEIDMASHINGMRHKENAPELQQKQTLRKQKEKVQGERQNLNEVPRMKDSRLFCKMCNVRCSSEIDMASHVNGMRHKENAQDLQQKQDPRKHKEKVQGEQQKLNEVPRMKDSRLFCKICKVHCSGEVDMASHLNGWKHKENVREQKQNANEAQRKNDLPLWCKICSVGCSGLITLESHLNGRKHEENVQKQKPNAKRKNDPLLWCKICNVGCSGQIALESHLNGRLHKENVQE